MRRDTLPSCVKNLSMLLTCCINSFYLFPIKLCALAGDETCSSKGFFLLSNIDKCISKSKHNYSDQNKKTRFIKLQQPVSAHDDHLVECVVSTKIQQNVKKTEVEPLLHMWMLLTWIASICLDALWLQSTFGIIAKQLCMFDISRKPSKIQCQHR